MNKFINKRVIFALAIIVIIKFSIVHAIEDDEEEECGEICELFLDIFVFIVSGMIGACDENAVCSSIMWPLMVFTISSLVLFGCMCQPPDEYKERRRPRIIRRFAASAAGYSTGRYIMR
jgi:hypothetical protein